MRIKIKELPVLSKKEVTDQDIMVIETTADTYQIPISDLKVTFSCDKKLEALSDDLNKKIKTLTETVDNNKQSCDEKNIEVANSLNLMNQTLANFSTRIKNNEDAIRDIHTHINEVIDPYIEESKTDFINLFEFKEKTETRLKDLEEITEKHNDKISDLEDLTEEQTEEITDINKRHNDLKQTVETNKTEIDETISMVDKRLDDKINRIHQELLTLIDSYHHETH